MKQIHIFLIPIFFRNRYRYFFRYQKISKPIPILFPIPKKIETDTDTFSDTNFFSKPIPILFSIPKISETDTDTIKKNGKVSKPRSFETEMSHSALYFQTSSTPLMPSRDYEKSWSNNWIENCSACSVSQSIPMLINNAVGQFVSKSTPWTLIKAAISSISRYFPSSTILSLPQWVSVRGQTLKQTTQDLQN